MNRKKMINKHLLTCSVILVLAIIFKLNIWSTTVAKSGPKSTQKISRFIACADVASTDYSFANETLPANKKVYRKMQYSLNKHNYRTIQSHILQIKAEKLFPIIEPILRAYGIPEDFKYLPLVESGLKEGTSTKGAAGLWQFMPGTARTYGLKVGHGIDERLNVRKATIAACKYIKGLHKEFNSWTLAAAAYNNGSIKLARAINKQSEDNYFRMKLNRETGTYVYNLIAMKAIIDHPQNYGYRQSLAYLQPKDQLLTNSTVL
ncbi:lytic transglycosylase domain-containing protein [Mucilaginibacter corticis]|uniref:Lytic transglycosylase domain-containing protein n=1 Tax=Mucilaginibacter corticis TaxID=2597670 RepID=A0A556MTU3_9SPHI|nr:lytic transglycosylase domain-containing protein [Mucilaginibacter corticis]TSJ43366.1 lytic transglycosylase domain-containing protein [Mucilaginibacter corticis]